MSDHEAGTERMLEDIRREFHYTTNYTGLEAMDARVEAALRQVPRQRFVPPEMAPHAFDNSPLPIGHGQTISQPFIVALMTSLLQVGPDDTVLEVGTGCGYQTAILATMVKQVYTIEIVPALGHAAAQRLHEFGIDNVEACVRDGHAGWPEHAPYDGIIVTAGAPEVPPALIEQLKPGGRLVVPVGRGFMGQDLLVVEKDDSGHTATRSILPVAFVPLVDRVEA